MIAGPERDLPNVGERGVLSVGKNNADSARAAVDRDLASFQTVTIDQIAEIAERHGVTPMVVRHRAAANYVRIGRKPVSKRQHAIRLAFYAGAFLAMTLGGMMIALRLMD